MGSSFLRTVCGEQQPRGAFGSQHSIGMKNGSSGTRVRICSKFLEPLSFFCMCFSLTLCLHSDDNKIIK